MSDTKRTWIKIKLTVPQAQALLFVLEGGGGSKELQAIVAKLERSFKRENFVGGREEDGDDE